MNALAALRDFFLRRRRNSGSLAKSRLHFVLVQDRTGLTNDDLTAFKREMMDVIERYFVVDKQGFDISYKRERDMTTLLINSPIVVRRQETPGQDAGARKARIKRKPQTPEVQQAL